MKKSEKNLERKLDVVSAYSVSDEMNVVLEYPEDYVPKVMSEEEVRDIMEEENYLLGGERI